jgi:hypothetical protein
MSKIGLIDRDILISYAHEDRDLRILGLERQLNIGKLSEFRANSLRKKIQKEKEKRITVATSYVSSRYNELLRYAVKRGKWFSVSGVGAGVGKTTFSIERLGAIPIGSAKEAEERGIDFFVIVSASERVKSLSEIFEKAEKNYIITASNEVIEKQRDFRAEFPSVWDAKRTDLESIKRAPINTLVLAKFATYYPCNSILIENTGKDNVFIEKGPITSFSDTLEEIRAKRGKNPPSIMTVGNFSLGPTRGHQRLLDRMLEIGNSLNLVPVILISPRARPVTLSNGNSLSLSVEERISIFKNIYGDSFIYKTANFNDLDIILTNVKHIVFGSDRIKDSSYLRRFMTIFGEEVKFHAVERKEESLESEEHYSSSLARKAIELNDWETFFKIQDKNAIKDCLLKHNLISECAI